MSAQAMLSPNLTIGLDVGDQRSSWCMVDGAGRVLERGQVRTVGTALRRLFERRPRSRVVLEVGTHSPWVSRLLGDLGHEVLVANARQLRLIYGRDRKNDRVDAETLARLGRVDPALLRPIHHRGAALPAAAASSVTSCEVTVRSVTGDPRCDVAWRIYRVLTLDGRGTPSGPLSQS